MDGVLIDTVLLHWRAYNVILNSDYGVSVKDSQLASLVGMSLPEQIPVLNKMLSISIEALNFIQKADKLKETYMNNLAPKAGVVQLLTDLKKHGILMAVGTSSSEIAANQRLKQVGIDHFFELIVGEEHVANHKPDPEVYLTCAKLLGVESPACVVIEDALNGLMAAQAAGIASVGVQTSYVNSSTLAEQANLVVDSLEEVNFMVLDSTNKNYNEGKHK